MKIKILGTGCPNCIELEKRTREAIKELGRKSEIEKITDIAKILSYGVMSTPALVVDEKVIFSGRVPSTKDIKKMLKGI